MGLHAAYISKFDAEQKKIGIHTYLLLNPPVDLLQAIEKIDRLAQLGKKLGPKQSKCIHAYGAGVAGEAFENAFDDPLERLSLFRGWGETLSPDGYTIPHWKGTAGSDRGCDIRALNWCIMLAF